MIVLGRIVIGKWWAGLLFLLPSLLVGQTPFPDPGPVFRDDVVPIVRIYLSTDSLAKMYQNPGSNHEFPATFIFESGMVRDTAFSVGIRFRGNTSRVSGKKSFKISFNTFNTRQSFFGLEKMNLNGEHNDPSIIRAKLCWDLYRMAGIPAPRANHIFLYINDIYTGVYINVEQIDEEFVGYRFGSKKGNLYKCLYPATLIYLSNNPNDYKFKSGNRRAYALKTNETEDDYSDLARLIDKLNRTPAGLFTTEIESVLNIPVLLRMMVVDVFVGNWDGPFYNKNNFYLYDNPLTGKFEIIPYDLDNTFGIDWFNKDWGTRNVYSWSPSDEPRPLYTKILEVPEYRKEYTRLFYQFLDQITNSDYLVQHALNIRNLYKSGVSTDPFYKRDYGWTYDDFLLSFDNRLFQGHVKYGLIPYIYTRIASARAQLDQLSDIEATTTDQRIRIYPNPATDYLVIDGGVNFNHWQIRNITGQQMMAGSVHQYEILRLNLQSLPSGTYFIILDPKPDSRYPIPVPHKLLICR